jgi:molybdopterin-containing oxidoreductase family iron-sulfur binding subunit
MDRRDFLKILGASSSAAVISSCGVDKANEKIIPYVIPPAEEIYPGKPLFVNTTCNECPANCGLEVRINEKVYDGVRGLYPTKLEGVKEHPVNDGTLCARGQAGLFRLYHPDRLKRPLMRDNDGNLRVVTWQEAFDRIREELINARGEGKSSAYLSAQVSGSLSDLIDEFCQKMKVERIPEFEFFSHANIKEANRIVFNHPVIPGYHIDQADFMLTIGADIFESFVSPVSHSRQYGKASQNDRFQWYHAEPHISLTGSQANQRMVVIPETEPVLLVFLIQTLIENNLQKKNLPFDVLNRLPTYSIEETTNQTGIPGRILRQLVRDLFRSKSPIVIAGGVSTAHEKGLEVAVLTAMLQWILGSTEEQVDFTHPIEQPNLGNHLEIAKLAKRLNKESIGILFISKIDVKKSLPSNYQFLELIKKSNFTVVLSDCINETVENCDCILPLSHSLECWGDAEPHQGLVSIFQPTIETQYDTFSEGDILLKFLGQNAAHQEYKVYLIEKWGRRFGRNKIDEILEKGYMEYPVTNVSLSLKNRSVRSFLEKSILQADEIGTVLVVAPSIRGYDGRSKTLPLLNEISDPLSSISYGEWISVSDEIAVEMGIRDRDKLEIRANNFEAKLPAKVQKLLPKKVFSVYREFIDFPVTVIDPRSGEMSWNIKNVTIAKTGHRIPLPILSGSMEEENRGLLPHEDEHGHSHQGEYESWYPEHEHDNYRWGMAIDLDSCIGCNACAAACYVENNVALVGKEEHLLGREMSWIRLQPYYDSNETLEFVPMLCQHCDNAPCEPVCPVYATYHNPEGLNVQVYNRCVGTRYCANNCPYKVRRFNWFDFRLPQPLDKMYNPDVSVRDRGIMEKCTFCIQRIRAAKDKAKDEERLVQDGELVPACAQTCPTNAITFGNLEDKSSKVYKLAHSDKAYRALEELGTQPAVHYLRKKGKENES